MSLKLGPDTVLVVTCMSHPFYGKVRLGFFIRSRLDLESNLKKKTFPLFDELIPIVSATEIQELKEGVNTIEVTIPWDYKT